MTKVSIQKVMLGLLSLSLIATDAFGNILPPVPGVVTQTNVNVRYSQTGYRPMPMPLPVPRPPMAPPPPRPPGPIGPMGPHGPQGQIRVQANFHVQGGQCGRQGCQGGGPRSCGGYGHCRARIRGCARFAGGGCGGGGGGVSVRVAVNIRGGGGGGCRMFGRGRRC